MSYTLTHTYRQADSESSQEQEDEDAVMFECVARKDRREIEE
jgi:hypothetical protein